MKKVAPIPKFGKRPGPIKLTRETLRPRGPEKYRLGRKPTLAWVGPGDPPAGFLDPKFRGSASEWRYFWAICKVMKDPLDCRKGPFTGGRNWSYQVAADAAFVRSVGSQVLDFTIDLPNGETIGLRIQTERYHVYAGSLQQAKDKFLRIRSKTVTKIYDLFDQNSIGDPTGKAVIAQVVRAMKGIQEPDPVALGTAQRIRPY